MRGPIRVGHAVALCTTLALVHAETTPHPNTAQGVNYIGDQRCRPCHLREFANYKRTGMGRSMSLPGEVPELQGSALPVTVKVDSPGRSYRVYRSGGKIFHEARAIDESARQIFSDTHEVTYAVGSGRTGRSYFVRRGEELFISPLSYYSSERRWDLSPGHETGQFRNFNRPAGELCVSCHSGLRLVDGASNSFRLPAAGSLSIGCERCHGPGQIHAGARDPQTARRSIVNPAKLPDALRDDVCNQCHLAGDARVVRPGQNVRRFQAGIGSGRHCDDLFRAAGAETVRHASAQPRQPTALEPVLDSDRRPDGVHHLPQSAWRAEYTTKPPHSSGNAVSPATHSGVARCRSRLASKPVLRTIASNAICRGGR